MRTKLHKTWIDGYNVYHAPDGCDDEYIGWADSLDDAQAMVGASGLPRSLYDTARAAGHCGGQTAPDTSREVDDAETWLDGGDGYYCAVPVRSECQDDDDQEAAQAE